VYGYIRTLSPTAKSTLVKGGVKVRAVRG